MYFEIVFQVKCSRCNKKVLTSGQQRIFEKHDDWGGTYNYIDSIPDLPTGWRLEYYVNKRGRITSTQLCYCPDCESFPAGHLG